MKAIIGKSNTKHNKYEWNVMYLMRPKQLMLLTISEKNQYWQIVKKKRLSDIQLENLRNIENQNSYDKKNVTIQINNDLWWKSSLAKCIGNTTSIEEKSGKIMLYKQLLLLTKYEKFDSDKSQRKREKYQLVSLLIFNRDSKYSREWKHDHFI